MPITLYSHQRAGRDLLLANARYALFWKPRVGKTITVLSACEAQPMHTVIVAPKTVVGTAWAGDAQHFPTLGFMAVRAEDGSLIERKDAIREHFKRHGAASIVAMNREVFTPLADWFAKASMPFRFVVDESSILKNVKTKSFGGFLSVARRAARVVLLSGTPAPNNGTEYYGQLACLNMARNLGFHKWANRYFVPIKRPVRVSGGVKKRVIMGWSQTQAQRAALQEVLSACSSSLSLADCFDLPRDEPQTIRVILSPKERAAYKEAEERLRIVIRDDAAKAGRSVPEVVSINPQALLTKLRQLTTGSVLVDGGVLGVGQSKLDALSDLLDAIGPSEPVVIWCEYRAEIDAVVSLMLERNEPFVRLDGRNADNTGDVKKFQAQVRSPLADDQPTNGIRAICHPLSVGHGVTLNAARYAVFVSRSFSAEQHEQARNRIVGHDATVPRATYILHADNTVDDAIADVLDRKMGASEAMLKALRMEA